MTLTTLGDLYQKSTTRGTSNRRPTATATTPPNHRQSANHANVFSRTLEFLNRQTTCHAYFTVRPSRLSRHYGPPSTFRWRWGRPITTSHRLVAKPCINSQFARQDQHAARPRRNTRLRRGILKRRGSTSPFNHRLTGNENHHRRIVRIYLDMIGLDIF